LKTNQRENQVNQIGAIVIPHSNDQKTIFGTWKNHFGTWEPFWNLKKSMWDLGTILGPGLRS
jgi:hypothetical protein